MSTSTVIKASPLISSERLLFKTGFEGTTTLGASVGPYFHGAREQYEDFSGVDVTVPSPNDWSTFGNYPPLGLLRLYHEGGNESQRYARIVPDDENPANRVLRFWIGEPNVRIEVDGHVQKKSRVQAELYGNTDLRELYQTVRMRLHPDMALIKQYPESFGWLTIAEFWNKPFWSLSEDPSTVPYPFRFSLSIRKLADGPVENLFFGTDSQCMLSDWPNFNTKAIWQENNADIAVPIGSWMTIESYYKEGDEETGRFFVAMTPDGGERQVVFDIRGWTHHPDNPSPEGLTHYNPIKVYTSAELVEYMRDAGSAVCIDWDDLAFWANRTPQY